MKTKKQVKKTYNYYGRRVCHKLSQTKFNIIKGLYLTGAGTFPGAGIFGAPGTNTAKTVLKSISSS